ncbi:hypothetical protein CLUG_00211 [Clavispora lusitaniae ATCC 42720]|uniref:RNA polymerase II subunit A C-terminal domain phosphatase n=1 Tax=Clavispora lusitaniae (strain ATCC 42720) TaxID=306902 RepID=C4XW88_CLAL4|nr:uncharacterized protein CLUG_00211 [Clavispora lusitaniae ATCC 42720]EEQ36088.1 hypothetical protein CLUG_00211 [Clavispora lusitaniae ATCC 42720]KAF5213367.1 Carboxy-terminal domain (CTD) phosphatase [Clavispora lusitaniae]
MTVIYLPPSAPFPVTVTAVLCRVGDTIQRHAPVIKYKYWDYQDDPNSKDDPPPKIRVERIGTFESPIEGEVTELSIAVNDEVAHCEVELCQIEEPCSHTVQYGGLCALCGKAVEDEKDYTGYNYEDRATIAMSHDNTGLRISLDEATKIEQSSTERLAADKKLILVVDLDQTVIHATVDPTVGEWQRDPQNPNYPFVKDVQLFSLEEEPIVPPGWVGPRPPPTKCWYYVKLRPGLKEFLAEVSKLYELHIYTMATRNYALAIASIIDPDGKYFGDRILSRDESGSLTHKNLRRLFPVDQSMVVIIDDRGDVWQWEANLIKVVPYDFFVGIGDINSSFLPKKNGQLVGPTKKRKTIARLEAMEEAEESENELREESATPDRADSERSDDAPESDAPDSDSEGSSPVERILEMGGGENNHELLIEQRITRSQSIEQQQHERPLAKLQHNLDKIIHDHETPAPESDGKEEEEDNLLYDDDSELSTLQTALEKIHQEYYKLYAKYKSNPGLPRPDLATIIPRLKSPCLSGVVVLFSGILPLGMNIDNADIVIWCRQFGVKVVNEVYPDVTHVVCRDPESSLMKPGLTLKVRVAKKVLPDCKIVNPDWLFACLSSWGKVDEKEYLINVPSQDWYVSESDLEKYMNSLETSKRSEQTPALEMSSRGREGSLSSIEEYDFNTASAEVDDFLAGISDDDDDDDEGNDDDDDEADMNGDAELEGEKAPSGGKSTFLQSLYAAPSRKRKTLDDDSDEEIESKKKPKEDNFDELEQELLDELNELEE